MINASDSITPSEYGMARQALNDVENPPPMYVHVIPGAAEPASGRGQRLIPEYAPGVTNIRPAGVKGLLEDELGVGRHPAAPWLPKQLADSQPLGEYAESSRSSSDLARTHATPSGSRRVTPPRAGNH